MTNTYFGNFLRKAAVAALLVVGSLAAPAAAPAAAAPAVTFEDRTLELINAARAAAGVKPVQASAGLAGVAADAPYQGCGFGVAGRSADMGARNYFSHAILDCPNKGVSNMLQAAGVPFTAMAENIAWVNAITDPLVAAERLHNDLMASPGHRRIVLDPAFTHVGVGSWHTAAGASWTGGGAALRNVYLTTQLFATMPDTPPPPPAPTGARYHPLTPSRILDTRAATPLGAGATMGLQVTGQGGVPASGVSAVILNVAVTGPTDASFLTVFPAGEARPWTANLNFGAGQTVPNLVAAKLGAGGRLSVYNAAGATHVIADVAGWYDDGTIAGAGYHPLTPARILDTRGAGPLGPSDTRALQVTGQGGVPATGVSAVVMNVAVTAPTEASYLTVFPAGEARPTASNLNFGAGDTVPNLVTAKLGAGGRVALYNAAGTTHVIADVAGWYDDGTSPAGARYHPVSPSRILDTRTATGPLAFVAPLDLQVAGQAGVPASGVSAVVMNVAVTEATAVSYLTVYPAGEAKPLAANLNFVPGQTVPNLVTAKVGAGGRVSLANATGTTHVIADVAGWFDAG